MSRNRRTRYSPFSPIPAAHGGIAATRIDTHGAAVFLAGDRVLKVKRAVKFPFLDYSTLDKRKAACEAELAVNRPFAPQIYRGVVAITRTASGGLAIGGTGRSGGMGARNDALRRECDARPAGGCGGGSTMRLPTRSGMRSQPRTRRRRSSDAGPWIAALSEYISPERRGVSRISRPVRKQRSSRHSPTRAAGRSNGCNHCFISAAAWG